MAETQLTHPGGVTEVVVQNGVLSSIGTRLRAIADSQGSALVVTDSVVGPLYSSQVVESLQASGWAAVEHRIPAGEASKSLAELDGVYGALVEAGVRRDGLIVAVGGGVVSDLSGLAAATWMRGIRWIVCPTTVEAAVDAAIGGKTAINLQAGKNLVGAFHHPVAVLVDPVCLESLPERDRCAGLAESVKHALIADDGFFEWHEANVNAISKLHPSIREELLIRNIEVKAHIVARDPREESGLRWQLNLGHTIGHAIESSCDYRLRHGECVSLGLVACNRLSSALGMLNATVRDRIEHHLSALGLPTSLNEPIEWSVIHEAMQRDKKARSDTLRFVLLKDFGIVIVQEGIDEDPVRQAYESLFDPR